ncbi:unnamed protein product [Gadus morhua 'NCC']
MDDNADKGVSCGLDRNEAGDEAGSCSASSSRRGVAVAAAAATFPAPHHPQRLITRTMCQHANLSPDRRPRGGGDRGSPPSRDLRPLGRPATATGDEAHTDTRTCWAGQHEVGIWTQAGVSRLRVAPLRVPSLTFPRHTLAVLSDKREGTPSQAEEFALINGNRRLTQSRRYGDRRRIRRPSLGGLDRLGAMGIRTKFPLPGIRNFPSQ